MPTGAAVRTVTSHPNEGVRTMGRIAHAVAAAGIAFSIAGTALAGNPQEVPKLPNNDVDARPLAASATFAASEFPLALRITTPDGSWVGGQGKIATEKRGSFGWVEF